MRFGERLLLRSLRPDDVEAFYILAANSMKRFRVVVLVGLAGFVFHQWRTVQASGSIAPKFVVDAYWPKPLPNGWLLGQSVGV